MNRSKSAKAGVKSVGPDKEDIRGLCKRIAPYITRQWRDVCEELGVPDDVLENVAADHVGSKLSSLAFQGLCCWHEMVGRSASKDKLLRVIHLCGLRRAEDEIRTFGIQKRAVPYLGRPTTATQPPEVNVNKQSKQKALADRLSRPKSNTTDSQQTTEKKHNATPVSKDKSNLMTLQITPSKQNEICEVKIKITVKGVQRFDQDEMKSTRDDFQSTKDDYKHTCHTFVKLVIADQKAHFMELKELLGFEGISVQRLTKVGFNITLFILCFSLGAFEILYQSYVSGRLKMIVQSCLVTRSYLEKLKAKQLELSVTIDDWLINKYREILMERGVCDPVENHPVDEIGMPKLDDDKDDHDTGPHTIDHQHKFNLNTWREQLEADVSSINERYKTFNSSVNDLLIILRIVKPPNTQIISSLKDIIDYFQYLRKSESVSKGARTDLVQEYLAIVNHIRLKTLHIRDYNVFISFEESLHPDACDTFHTLLEEVEEMLRPCVKFEVDEDEMTQAVSGMEREMFGGLLCYIPKLISKLFALSDTLTRTVEVSDTKEQLSVTEQNGFNEQNSVAEQNGETEQSSKAKQNGVTEQSSVTKQNGRTEQNDVTVLNDITSHNSESEHIGVTKQNGVTMKNRASSENGIIEHDDIAAAQNGETENSEGDKIVQIGNTETSEQSSTVTTCYLSTWSPRTSLRR